MSRPWKVWDLYYRVVDQGSRGDVGDFTKVDQRPLRMRMAQKAPVRDVRDLWKLPKATLIYEALFDAGIVELMTHAKVFVCRRRPSGEVYEKNSLLPGEGPNAGSALRDYHPGTEHNPYPLYLELHQKPIREVLVPLDLARQYLPGFVEKLLVMARFVPHLAPLLLDSSSSSDAHPLPAASSVAEPAQAASSPTLRLEVRINAPPKWYRDRGDPLQTDFAGCPSYDDDGVDDRVEIRKLLLLEDPHHKLAGLLGTNIRSKIQKRIRRIVSFLSDRRNEARVLSTYGGSGSSAFLIAGHGLNEWKQYLQTGIEVEEIASLLGIPEVEKHHREVRKKKDRYCTFHLFRTEDDSPKSKLLPSSNTRINVEIKFAELVGEGVSERVGNYVSDLDQSSCVFLSGRLFSTLVVLQHLAGVKIKRQPWVHPGVLRRFLHTIEKQKLLCDKLNTFWEPFTNRRKPDFLDDDDSVSLGRGILFHGPPGTGKSFLTVEMMQKLGVRLTNPDGNLAASRFEGGLVGSGGRNIKKEMDLVRCYGVGKDFLHCAVLDEAESLLMDRERSSQGNSGSTHNLETLSSFLPILADTFKNYSNIVFVAATNFKGMIDDAATREGRLDCHLYYGGLSRQQRLGLAPKWFGTRPEIDDELVSLLTVNFTYSQMKTAKDRMLTWGKHRQQELPEEEDEEEEEGESAEQMEEVTDEAEIVAEQLLLVVRELVRNSTQTNVDYNRQQLLQIHPEFEGKLRDTLKAYRDDLYEGKNFFRKDGMFASDFRRTGLMLLLADTVRRDAFLLQDGVDSTGNPLVFDKHLRKLVKFPHMKKSHLAYYAFAPFVELWEFERVWYIDLFLVDKRQKLLERLHEIVEEVASLRTRCLLIIDLDDFVRLDQAVQISHTDEVQSAFEDTKALSIEQSEKRARTKMLEAMFDWEQTLSKSITNKAVAKADVSVQDEVGSNTVEVFQLEDIVKNARSGRLESLVKSQRSKQRERSLDVRNSVEQETIDRRSDSEREGKEYSAGAFEGKGGITSAFHKFSTRVGEEATTDTTTSVGANKGVARWTAEDEWTGTRARTQETTSQAQSREEHEARRRRATTSDSTLSDEFTHDVLRQRQNKLAGNVKGGLEFDSTTSGSLENAIQDKSSWVSSCERMFTESIKPDDVSHTLVQFIRNKTCEDIDHQSELPCIGLVSQHVEVINAFMWLLKVPKIHSPLQSIARVRVIELRPYDNESQRDLVIAEVVEAKRFNVIEMLVILVNCSNATTVKTKFKPDLYLAPLREEGPKILNVRVLMNLAAADQVVQVGKQVLVILRGQEFQVPEVLKKDSVQRVSSHPSSAAGGAPNKVYGHNGKYVEFPVDVVVENQ